jgi:hypothetical protein
MDELIAQLLAHAAQRHKAAIAAIEARPVASSNVQAALAAFAETVLLAEDARQLCEEQGCWEMADSLGRLIGRVEGQQAMAMAVTDAVRRNGPRWH